MNDLILIDGISVEQVQKQIQLIQNLMSKVMQKDVHFGEIPGTDKPSLYKAGAEKLCFMFRLIPEFKYANRDLPGGHMSCEVICNLMHGGNVVGSGIGFCSTMEKKYRYRSAITILDEPLPKDFWDNRDTYKKKGLIAKKIDGQWVACKYSGDREENPDIADCYNTVMKIAEKRAHVNATIRATAASDIFTQDIEDMPEESISQTGGKRGPKPKSKPEKKPVPEQNGGEKKTLEQLKKEMEMLIDDEGLNPGYKAMLKSKLQSDTLTEALATALVKSAIAEIHKSENKAGKDSESTEKPAPEFVDEDLF